MKYNAVPGWDLGRGKLRKHLNKKATKEGIRWQSSGQDSHRQEHGFDP